jgi:hypothetical protein
MSTTRVEIPLHEKDALTYEEVEALGYCSRRQLERLVMLGRVKRSVLRPGRQMVRFLRSVLIEELKERGGRRGRP